MSIHRIGLRVPKAARCLFLVSSLVLSAGPAAAQTTLDQVVITATREPQPLSRATSDIVVIDAETIRKSTADSVEDLLRREAGMQLARNGGPGQSSGYFIRGASSNGTLVLIDGVRIGAASLGQAELEALSLGQIERIEVLRGPASSLYGADAVGGVVQIFTRRGEGPPRLSGGASIGGYASRQADLGVSGAQAGFDYAVSAGREKSRGVSAIRPGDQFGLYNPDDDGYSRTFGNVRLGYTPAAGHRIGINLIETKLNAQYDSADYPPPAFAPDATADFRNHLKTTLAALDYRGVVNGVWTTSLQLAHNVDDAKTGSAVETRFITHRDQGTWQNSLRLATDQQVVLAYEYLREQVGGTTYVSEPQRHNNAFVAGYSGQFGASGLQADLRRDDNSKYGGDTTGRLGYSFELVRGLKLRALAGTTYRAPTFNETDYPFYGVTTLKPEEGRSFEIGAAWQGSSTSASATLYRNRVRNLIGYDPDPTGTHCPTGFFGCAGNTARARLQGATLAAGQRWGGLDVRLSADLLDATDADTGIRLARRAAHQETLSADYDAGPWSVGGSLLDIGARPDGTVTLGGYGLVNLRAAWRFLPQWRLEAKLLNALDHSVEPVRDYQGLGRQAWLGIRFDGRGL